MDRNTIRYGSEETLPERRALVAGPYSLYFENGDLRRITLAGREVVRRIYVAVRDRNWGTVAGNITDLEIEADDDSFAIAYECVARHGEIDFGWHCDIRGTPDGTITYSIEGTAQRDFWSNRVGICVLHPIDGCAGRRAKVGLVDGKEVLGRFPLFISPHQPFTDIRSICHEVGPGVWSEVSFEGAVFEMEDQRNWSDASFKTYSGVLREPYPFQVTAGQVVAQSVTLRPRGQSVPSRAGAATQADVSVSIGREPVGIMPRLGLGVPERGGLSETEAARLRALGLAHIRVDLALSRSGWGNALDVAADAAEALDAKLEVAVTLADDEEQELFELARRLPELGDLVARWLVFHEGEDCTSERWLRLARRQLAAPGSSAWFGGGSDLYFTELNRGTPPVGAADFICFPITPQVHAFDVTSIVETLGGQAWAIASAKRVAAGRPLAVGPVTLRPRHWPGGKGAERRSGTDVLPPEVDARQRSLFAAAWTVGSLKQVAEGGAYSATYFETVGWRGVMEREEGSPWPSAFPSPPGSVFPLYHVFAALRDAKSAVVLPAVSTDPLRVQALALRSGGGARVLLANLTPERQRVSVIGLADSLALRTLDEDSAEQAMTAPNEFVEGPAQLLGVSGITMLQLQPYAVAFLDEL